MRNKILIAIVLFFLCWITDIIWFASIQPETQMTIAMQQMERDASTAVALRASRSVLQWGTIWGIFVVALVVLFWTEIKSLFVSLMKEFE